MVHFSECSTAAANCNNETQIEMRGGTVEHFPARATGAAQTDAAVLAPRASAAEEESAETVSQPRTEGFVVGDAAKVRGAPHLVLPTNAAKTHSHIARLILTNKRGPGNLPDPYRKERGQPLSPSFHPHELGRKWISV